MKPLPAPSLLRALPLVAPVAAAGTAVTVAAALHMFLTGVSPSVFAAVGAMLLAATITEAYPVPIESIPAGQVSLAAVFVVGAAVIYGWAEAALVAFGARTAIEVIQRRPADQLLYNGPVYALAAAAAGAAAWNTASSTSTLVLSFDVLSAAFAFYLVNVVLVTAMVALATARPFGRLLMTAAVRTIVPFGIMASSALMLAVLWQQEPLLSLALVGPLLAFALYQRSVHRALVATRLALTDSLTGLGNQRHFHERLQQELDAAAASGAGPLALCILDVDGLKRVNDTYGHPIGDRLLESVAGCIRHGGEGFRVGGDEFALLLPGRDANSARDIAAAVLERAAAVEVVPGSSGVRVSAGVAIFPTHCRERNELYRCADEALYASKRAGGNDVVVFSPSPPPEMRSISGGS